MQAYLDRKIEAKFLGGEIRQHPWTKGMDNPEFRYVDFKGVAKQQIAEHLEDLQPISETAAAQAVVDFIAWANSNASPFETNDFATEPIRPSQSSVTDSTLEMIARISVLFRHLPNNIGHDRLENFGRLVEHQLHRTDQDFTHACWGWCLWPHGFKELLDSNQPGLGDTLCFHVWVWGDSEDEVHANFSRAFVNLRIALQAAIAEVSKPQQQ